MAPEGLAEKLVFALQPEGDKDTQSVLLFSKHLWSAQKFCQCEVRFSWWISRKMSTEQCCLLPEVQGQFHGIIKSRLALLEYGEWGARWEERVAQHRCEDGNGGSNHRCSERMLTSEYRVQRLPGTPFSYRNQPVSPCLLCPTPVVWFLS